MKLIEFKSLCVGLCIGVAAVFGLGAAPQGHQTLEYKVITGDIWSGEFQKKLNDTVPDGWHLEKAETFAERHGFAILTRLKQ